MPCDVQEAEAPLVGGRLGETRRIFGFEADFAASLRCIPMVVRFKLDRCGIKLSLKQWSRMGAAHRFALADRRCDTHAEVKAYREELLRLIGLCSAGDPVFLPVDENPEWANGGKIPGRIADMIAEAGLTPLSIAAWSGLSTLERFALLKLTRPGHDNENFLPAMREFGLATPSSSKQ